MIAALAWIVVWFLVELILAGIWSVFVAAGAVITSPGRPVGRRSARGLSRAWWNPFRFAIGADDSPSTSKFQFLLWTMVVTYAFLVVVVARVQAGIRSDYVVSGIDFDPNLLLVMGYSVATTAAAAAITVQQLGAGTKQQPSATNTSGSALVQGDNGQADLGKIQLLAWTLIAQGVFLYMLVFGGSAINDRPQMPKLDSVLMVLIGLAQAAYLGNKLVTTTTPRFLGGANPAIAGIGDTVTVPGAALGDNSSGSVLLVGGEPLEQVDWSPTKVTFPLPGYQADGTPWGDSGWPNPALPITGWVNGQAIVSNATLRIPRPRITNVQGGLAADGNTATVVGQFFGPPSADPRDNQAYLVDGTGTRLPIPQPWITWTATQIVVRRDDGAAPAPGWTTGTGYTFVVTSYGRDSNPFGSFTP